MISPTTLSGWRLNFLRRPGTKPSKPGRNDTDEVSDVPILFPESQAVFLVRDRLDHARIRGLVLGRRRTAGGHEHRRRRQYRIGQDGPAAIPDAGQDLDISVPHHVGRRLLHRLVVHRPQQLVLVVGGWFHLPSPVDLLQRAAGRMA